MEFISDDFDHQPIPENRLPRCIVEFYERRREESHKVEVKVLPDGSLDVQQMIKDLQISELIDIRDMILFFFKFEDPKPEKIWVIVTKSSPEIESFSDKNNEKIVWQQFKKAAETSYEGLLEQNKNNYLELLFNSLVV